MLEKDRKGPSHDNRTRIHNSHLFMDLGLISLKQKSQTVCSMPQCKWQFPSQAYDFIELWAGKAVTSSVIRKSGKGVASLDIEYFKPDASQPQRSNHFDILTDSGFSLHGFTIHTPCMHACTLYLLFPRRSKSGRFPYYQIIGFRS